MFSILANSITQALDLLASFQQLEILVFDKLLCFVKSASGNVAILLEFPTIGLQLRDVAVAFVVAASILQRLDFPSSHIVFNFHSLDRLLAIDDQKVVLEFEVCSRHASFSGADVKLCILGQNALKHLLQLFLAGISHLVVGR